jgi:hypothetical protein
MERIVIKNEKKNQKEHKQESNPCPLVLGALPNHLANMPL